MLRVESGVHCVQRLSGHGKNKKPHTSTVNVIVLPVIAERQLELRENDLRIDTYRSQGKGGQHVNVTDSAVRITHLPTGIVAQCQSERSQGSNKQSALAVLRSRLNTLAKEERLKTLSTERRNQLNGSGLAKLKTYNQMQNRVTNHSTGAAAKMNSVMRGESF